MKIATNILLLLLMIMIITIIMILMIIIMILIPIRKINEHGGFRKLDEEISTFRKETATNIIMTLITIIMIKMLILLILLIIMNILLLLILIMIINIYYSLFVKEIIPREIMLKAVQQSGVNLKHAPLSLKRDREVIIIIVVVYFYHYW